MRTELHYAVAVGIDRYFGLNRLNHARADAIAFDGWLGKEAGVADGHRTLITYDGDPDSHFAVRSQAMPTAQDVWDAIDAHLCDVRERIDDEPEAWPDTRLIVYFAGHGIAPRALDTAGLSAWADRNNLGLGMSFPRLKEWLAESRDFAEVVFIADCCRNKPRGRVTVAGPPWGTVSNDRDDVKFAELYAARYGATSREPSADTETGGYFTTALLEALRGAAPGDGEYISAHEAGDWARRQVIALTENKQAPPPPAGAELALVARPAHAAAPLSGAIAKARVRIRLTDAMTGRIVIEDHDLRPLRTLEVIEGWAETFLAPGLYLAKLVTGPRAGAESAFPVKPDVLEVTVEL